MENNHIEHRLEDIAYRTGWNGILKLIDAKKETYSSYILKLTVNDFSVTQF